MDEPSRRELEAAHCWEADDRVPGRPQMTAFRRRLRLHQARWREAHGHPIGTQPIVPRKGTATRPVGAACRWPTRKRPARTSSPPARSPPHEREPRAPSATSGSTTSVSAPTCSGRRHSPSTSSAILPPDLSLADRAVHAWWPDAPGTVSEIRFAHSPGRFDPTYLGSLRSFDAAFVLDLDDGTHGIVAIDVNYHEHAKPATAKPAGRPLHARSLDGRASSSAERSTPPTEPTCS
jgi:hypothetical protein